MKTLKEIIERQAAINARMAEIRAEADKPETTAERMAELNTEVDNLTQERNELVRKSVQLRSTASQFRNVIPDADPAGDEGEDLYASKAYRKAFMNWVLRHEDNEILHRNDASTVKSGIASVIVPTTITDKLFETDELAGSIFDRVTKTNYTPGIGVKTSAFKPTLNWVAENGKSDRQAATTGEIVFNGYKGEIRVAISLEASTMSLDAFESKLNTKILEACRAGFDTAIVSGTGSGQPKGILTEGTYTGATSNAYTLNNVTVEDYSEWIKIYAKIPQAKKAKALLHINAADWYAHIFGMKDNNGNVIALNTVGFGGNMVPTFMGRPVVLLEDQGLAAFDTITGSSTKSKTTAFAYFFDDADYYFNSNLQLRLKEYTDEDTDETIHKATIIADGKVGDTKSLVIVCRGADAT